MRSPLLRRLFFALVPMLGLHQATWAQSDSERAPAPDSKIYWIFLVTGKGTQGVERSEVTKMQAAHIANFGKLHQEGKLFAAGPLNDPQKKMRGIVVATAPDLKALSELFDADPYVKQGFLKLDAIEMSVAVGKFHDDIEPGKLAEYRLVLLEKSAADTTEIDAHMQQQNLEYCQSIHDANRLCFVGWLRDEKSARRGILIFRKLDDLVLQQLVDELPSMKSKSWKATTIPLFMSDSVVK